MQGAAISFPTDRCCFHTAFVCVVSSCVFLPIWLHVISRTGEDWPLPRERCSDCELPAPRIQKGSRTAVTVMQCADLIAGWGFKKSPEI